MGTRKTQFIFKTPNSERRTTKRSSFECKQANLSDIERIQSLATLYTENLFGESSIENLIKQKFCLCLYKNGDELIAFVAFCRRPNVPALPNFNWEPWLRKFYRLEEVIAWNSIFIHYMVWDDRYRAYFLVYILKAVYKEDIYLKYVLLIAPPYFSLSDAVGLVFTKVLPIDEENPTHCQYLYLHYRHTAVPKLMIHKATEEENMDYIPIIQQHSSVLMDTYGDDFFGELIAIYSGLDRVFLAAEEVKGTCIGVISLAPVNSYDLISHHFDVCPYHGFCKPEDNDLQNTYIHSIEYSRRLIPGFKQVSLISGMDPSIVNKGNGGSDFEGINNEISKASSGKASFVFEEKGTEFEIIDEFVTRFVYDLTTSEFTYSPDIVHASYSSYLIDLDHIDKDKTNFSIFSFAGRSKLRVKQEKSLKDIKSIQLEKPIFIDHKPPSLRPGNAFLIETFAMDRSSDSRLSHDLLEAAFECFPGKDYCLLTQPSRYPMFPLIEYFTKVVRNQRKSFPHQLYFIHRNGVFTKFSVRSAHISDFETIKSMISHMYNNKIILNELMLALTDDQTSSLSYVLLSEDSVVGFTMIRPYFETMTLRGFYNVEELMEFSCHDSKENGLIEHFVLSPIFLKFSQFFLRETLRLSSLQGLFYKIYFPSTEVWSGLVLFDVVSIYPSVPIDETINMIKEWLTNSNLSDTELDLSLISVLADMIAIQPTHPIQYNIKRLGEYAPPQEYIEVEPLALYYVNEQITMTKKTEINSKIVIVGGSDTALGFIEHLIFRPSRKDFIFTNITLVASHGLPNEMTPHEARDAMIRHSGKYKHVYIKKLGLHTYINIVYGCMTSINRVDKTITVDGTDIIYYEYLFLFTGVQYPIPLQYDLRKLFSSTSYCRKNLGSSNICNYLDNPPHNLFLINSQIDATNALQFVKECFDEMKPRKFIVYGSGIGPINCITSLLMFGVPAKRIEFVCQDLAEEINCFNNNDVHHFVISCLLELNIHISGPYDFQSWILDPVQNQIRTVTFQHMNEELNLECLGFFCYENRITSAKTFNAIINCGIVYNGLIVIDRNFHTNDPCIFAAGPGTKYANHYYAEDEMHKNYNSIEVGEMVSRYFCATLEAECEGLKYTEEGSLGDSVLIRRLTEPKTILCKLPHGLNYLHIYQCGRIQPYIGINKNKILATGFPLVTQKQRYFNLVLNSNGYIKEITCLTTEEIPDHNYFRLFGKHEKLLNNLVERYEKNYIHDFFSYFSQPWAYAIYDSKFPQLQQKITKIYEQTMPILNQIKEEYTIVEDTEQQLFRILVMKELMNFITQRSTYLPMYINYNHLAALQFLWNSSPVYQQERAATTSESIESQYTDTVTHSKSFGSEEDVVSTDEFNVTQSGSSTDKVTLSSFGSEVELDMTSEETTTISESDKLSSKASKTDTEDKSLPSNVIEQNILSSEEFSQSISSSTLSSEHEMFKEVIDNPDLNLLQSLKLIINKLNLPSKKNAT